MVRGVIEELRGILASKHAPRDILIELTGSGAPNKESAKLALESIKELPFRRMAAFSKAPIRVQAVKEIFKLADSSDRLKLFRDETDARNWLEDVSPGGKLKRQVKRVLPKTKHP